MAALLRNRTYQRLFVAQVVALVGTGVLTVALGLLAYDLAGPDAGVVLGTALTIKMSAYVLVAPAATAVAHRLPRRGVLVSMDAVRAVAALSLPLLTEVWQIYLLVFVLQAASATFTPTYQAVLPEVLPDEGQYTRALSLSRLAYDLESLLSPVLAAALLSVFAFDDLFVGTAAGFVASMALVAAGRLPATTSSPSSSFVDRLTRGVRLFAGVGRLRGLLALNLVVACSTAMVVVNTVVVVQSTLGRPQGDVAVLLAAYGGGSMVVALVLPRVLRRRTERELMLVGAAGLGGGLVVASALVSGPATGVVTGMGRWVALLALWAVLGAATSLVLTPSGRVLRDASPATDRPAAFAAQFSLSHACFALTYPLAGIVGARIGLPAVALLLAALAGLGLVLAHRWWPATHRAPHEQAPHDQARHDQAPQDQAPQEQAGQDQAAQDQAAQDQAAQARTSRSGPRPAVVAPPPARPAPRR